MFVDVDCKLTELLGTSHTSSTSWGPWVAATPPRSTPSAITGDAVTNLVGLVGAVDLVGLAGAVDLEC